MQKITFSIYIIMLFFFHRILRWRISIANRDGIMKRDGEFPSRNTMPSRIAMVIAIRDGEFSIAIRAFRFPSRSAMEISIADRDGKFSIVDRNGKRNSPSRSAMENRKLRLPRLHGSSQLRRRVRARMPDTRATSTSPPAPLPGHGVHGSDYRPPRSRARRETSRNSDLRARTGPQSSVARSRPLPGGRNRDARRRRSPPLWAALVRLTRRAAEGSGAVAGRTPRNPLRRWRVGRIHARLRRRHACRPHRRRMRGVRSPRDAVEGAALLDAALVHAPRTRPCEAEEEAAATRASVLGRRTGRASPRGRAPRGRGDADASVPRGCGRVRRRTNRPRPGQARLPPGRSVCVGIF